jgi:putative FmdB family regulatory protein
MTCHPPDVPTYEYRCPKGHDFEHFVPRISEAQSAMECPECGALAARRISAGGGLLFKGSGFYITDYGKDGKKAERDKVSAAKGGEAGKAESAKSETPAAKPAETASKGSDVSQSSEKSSKSSVVPKSSDSK